MQSNVDDIVEALLGTLRLVLLDLHGRGLELHPVSLLVAGWIRDLDFYASAPGSGPLH